jgi:hypothetical protein
MGTCQFLSNRSQSLEYISSSLHTIEKSSTIRRNRTNSSLKVPWYKHGECVVFLNLSAVRTAWKRMAQRREPSGWSWRFFRTGTTASGGGGGIRVPCLPPIYENLTTAHVIDLLRTICFGECIGDISVPEVHTQQHGQRNLKTRSNMLWCGCISHTMDHCLATVSGSVTDASHFISVIFMRLYQIDPYPEENGCVNRRGTSSAKHISLSRVVQLDQFCCEPVFPIELFLQGATIEFGTHNGFVNNCENRFLDVSTHDMKLVKVELGETDRG